MVIDSCYVSLRSAMKKDGNKVWRSVFLLALVATLSLHPQVVSPVRSSHMVMSHQVADRPSGVTIEEATDPQWPYEPGDLIGFESNFVCKTQHTYCLRRLRVDLTLL